MPNGLFFENHPRTEKETHLNEPSTSIFESYMVTFPPGMFGKQPNGSHGTMTILITLPGVVAEDGLTNRGANRAGYGGDEANMEKD